nr:serine/threonine-protein kinase BUR1-like [Equus caballus]XP_023480168.1 serine/threonine-protein kinase BUR1-like [Equus caballus]
MGRGREWLKTFPEAALPGPKPARVDKVESRGPRPELETLLCEVESPHFSSRRRPEGSPAQAPAAAPRPRSNGPPPPTPQPGGPTAPSHPRLLQEIRYRFH